MKKLFLCLIALSFLCLPMPAQAAVDPNLFLTPHQSPQPAPYSTEGWYINSFDDAIQIQPDGKIHVSETITVDFKDLVKHGIYREIPVIYRGDHGNDIYTAVSIQQVLQDGSPAQFDRTTNGDFDELKIGDPNNTISGIHTYKIDYDVAGVLRGFSTYDELFWNVTGNEWPVPILESHATISLPKDGIIQFTCYEGMLGSRGADCITKRISDREISVSSSGPYDTGGGLTAVLGFKKGMVPLLVVSKPKTLFEKFVSPDSLIIFGFASFFGIVLAVYLWVKNGRDSWLGNTGTPDLKSTGTTKPIGAHETVVVEYTPPQNLRPAEIGVLMDEKADTLDVTSTIIDLAARGFLTIKEIPKKWVFGSVDYELEKKGKSTQELRSYEKLLFDRLFDERKTVKISSLKKTFYSDLAKVKKSLYDDVQDQKLFSQNPETIRSKYGISGLLLVVAGVVISSFIGTLQFIYGIDLGLALICTGIFVIIFSFKMPKRTAYGRELYRQAKGYELFISTAEKYRQRFFENKNLFNEILPYAIVFGLTDKFAKAMHDIGIKPENPTWYVGTGQFNPVIFASNVSSFSNSFSSAITAAPSSRGGFSSGGGFSGGGFGGGGGGSW